MSLNQFAPVGIDRAQGLNGFAIADEQAFLFILRIGKGVSKRGKLSSSTLLPLQ
jgi:hypothetical protein